MKSMTVPQVRLPTVWPVKRKVEKVATMVDDAPARRGDVGDGCVEAPSVNRDDEHDEILDDEGPIGHRSPHS